MQRFFLAHQDVYITKYLQQEESQPREDDFIIKNKSEISLLSNSDPECYELIVIDYKGSDAEKGGHTLYFNSLFEYIEKLGIEYTFVEFEKRPYLSKKAGQ